MQKIFIILGMSLVLAGAWFFFHEAQSQTGYFGVPSVSCVNPTEPIVQNFSFAVHIVIDGTAHPLDPAIGHDPGTCLRIIHTNDTSGKVYVQSNDAAATYTLRNFFEVWHQEFSKNVVVGHILSKGETMKVMVNGASVSTYEYTFLHANDMIEIIVH